ncbi:hypothetical protein MAR_010458, partial [Mya arenaria]
MPPELAMPPMLDMPHMLAMPPELAMFPEQAMSPLLDDHDLNGSCPDQAWCQQANSSCVNNTCVCQEKYYVELDQSGRKTCVLPLGADCGVGDKCGGDNTRCFNKKCACLPAYFLDSQGQCQPYRDIGEACGTRNECADEYTVCELGVCTCNGSFSYEYTEGAERFCRVKRASVIDENVLNRSCNIAAQMCVGLNVVCSPEGTCVCADGAEERDGIC